MKAIRTNQILCPRKLKIDLLGPKGPVSRLVWAVGNVGIPCGARSVGVHRVQETLSSKCKAICFREAECTEPEDDKRAYIAIIVALSVSVFRRRPGQRVVRVHRFT